MSLYLNYEANMKTNKFLVSKETVVLRRWERSKQKFGFIKRVDKGERIWKADVSSVSPSSERIANNMKTKSE